MDIFDPYKKYEQIFKEIDQHKEELEKRNIQMKLEDIIQISGACKVELKVVVNGTKFKAVLDNVEFTRFLDWKVTDLDMNYYYTEDDTKVTCFSITIEEDDED